MSNAVMTQEQGAMLEQVLIGGDLSRLKAEDRVMYYKQVCESVGLNPITKPFEYITLNGKLTLYALRSCTEQLRKINGVSIIIKSREVVEDCYVVTAQATDAKGRHDESIGAVNIQGLKGEARSNAMMKAETKAKRRVTLSICGLGMLDESEADSIPGAYPAPASPTAGVLQSLPVKDQEMLNETAAQMRALHANGQVFEAWELMETSGLDNDQRVALMSLLDSKTKNAIGRVGEAQRAQEKGVISPAKHKRLEALIKEHKLNREGLKDWCMQEFEKGHFTELTDVEYHNLDNHIATLIAPPPGNPVPPPPLTEPVAGATIHISSEQESQLIDLLEANGISLKTFLQFGKLTSLAKLPADRYDNAVAWIKKHKTA